MTITADEARRRASQLAAQLTATSQTIMPKWRSATEHQEQEAADLAQNLAARIEEGWRDLRDDVRETGASEWTRSVIEDARARSRDLSILAEHYARTMEPDHRSAVIDAIVRARNTTRDALAEIIDEQRAELHNAEQIPALRALAAALAAHGLATRLESGAWSTRPVLRYQSSNGCEHHTAIITHRGHTWESTTDSVDGAPVNESTRDTMARTIAAHMEEA